MDGVWRLLLAEMITVLMYFRYMALMYFSNMELILRVIHSLTTGDNQSTVIRNLLSCDTGKNIRECCSARKLLDVKTQCNTKYVFMHRFYFLLNKII